MNTVMTFFLTISTFLFSISTFAMEEPLNKKLVKRNKKFINKVKDEKTFCYTLKTLLEKNADPNIVDEGGVTPLYHLTTQKKLSKKKVKLLLEHKADCSKENLVLVQDTLWTIRPEYPLARVTERFCEKKSKKSIAVIKMLLEHDADPQSVNAYGYALLHTIMRACDIEEDTDAKDLISFIIDHKGDINSQESEMGYTPFHLLFFNRKPKIETIKFFLEHSADPNILDYTRLNISETNKPYCSWSPFVRFFMHYTSATKINYDILKLFAQHSTNFKLIATRAFCFKNNDTERLKLLRFLSSQGVDFAHDPILIKVACEEDTWDTSVISFFLECNIDPTITIDGKFLFDYTHNIPDRRMLLKAMTRYIKKKYITSYAALFLCLKRKSEECFAYRVPAPIRRLLFEMICADLQPYLNMLGELKKEFSYLLSF